MSGSLLNSETRAQELRFVKHLSSGSFGLVSLVEHKQTKKCFAKPSAMIWDLCTRGLKIWLWFSAKALKAVSKGRLEKIRPECDDAGQDGGNPYQALHTLNSCQRWRRGPRILTIQPLFPPEISNGQTRERTDPVQKPEYLIAGSAASWWFKPWPFWDGDNVSLSMANRDLQRSGIKRSLWITWLFFVFRF